MNDTTKVPQQTQQAQPPQSPSERQILPQATDSTNIKERNVKIEKDELLKLSPDQAEAVLDEARVLDKVKKLYAEMLSEPIPDAILKHLNAIPEKKQEKK